MNGQSWVRLWSGMTTDPKWKTIARKSGRPLTEVIAVFAHAMLLANEAEERGSLDGWCTEDVASALDMEEEHVEAIRAAMDGRVIDNGNLSGWEKRQPIREDSGNTDTGAKSNTQRVREFRERKRAGETQGNTPKRNETQCNAPEAEAEAEAEAETETDKTGVIASACNSTTHVPPRTVPPDGGALAFSPGILTRPMVQAGIRCNPGHPDIVALAKAGCTELNVQAAVAEARRVKGDGASITQGYVVAILKRWQTEPARMLPKAQAPPGHVSRFGKVGNETAAAAQRWLEKTG